MFLPVATIMIILLRFSLKIDAELLGSPNDAAEICWSNKEISIDKTTLPLIVYYLKSCADTLALMHSPSKRELSAVLSRKIHDAIPAVNKAYYEGNIDYSIVRDLHKLYESKQCQRAPDTIGKVRRKRNWIKIRSPRSLQKPVMPLIIQANQTEKEEACNTLIVSSSSGRRQRRKVPLPFLDNVERPKRIAVPFISKPLYNLSDSDAKSLLVKYYITGVKCLSLSSEHNQDILVFNRNFYIWLLKCILPRIERDSKLYPAFGGVFKILETIHDKGLIDLNHEIESNIGNEICVKPSSIYKMDKQTHSDATAKRNGKVAIASSSFCIIITLVLTTFLFLTWLLIVFLFLFCRCCRYHQMKRDSETDANDSCSKEQLLQEQLPIEDPPPVETKICSTPLANEIRPVSTEFCPLITATPDRDTKRCVERFVTKCADQSRFEKSTPLSPIPRPLSPIQRPLSPMQRPLSPIPSVETEKEREKPRNTGFSKFLAPIKREKEETLMVTEPKNEDKECKLAEMTKADNESPRSGLRNDQKEISDQCADNLPSWQCSKSQTKWKFSSEKKLPGGGQSETTIEVFPNTLSQKPSPAGGSPYKRKKGPSKTQSECTKKDVSNSSVSRKASTGSMRSEAIDVDSDYKCQIKFVGERPKCEQCSDNLYNDVLNMIKVYKGASIMDSGSNSSEESTTSEAEPENKNTISCMTKSALGGGSDSMKTVPV